MGSQLAIEPELIKENKYKSKRPQKRYVRNMSAHVQETLVWVDI
jgi:hypothetical protein